MSSDLSVDSRFIVIRKREIAESGGVERRPPESEATQSIHGISNQWSARIGSFEAQRDRIVGYLKDQLVAGNVFISFQRNSPCLYGGAVSVPIETRKRSFIEQINQWLQWLRAEWKLRYRQTPAVTFSDKPAYLCDSCFCHIESCIKTRKGSGFHR
jgi:hypothetical protein